MRLGCNSCGVACSEECLGCWLDLDAREGDSSEFGDWDCFAGKGVLN